MIGPTGIWDKGIENLHVHSRELLDKLATIVPPGIIIDFGCGNGYYLRELKELDEQDDWDVYGVDGTNLQQDKFCIFTEYDLTIPLDMGIKDTVLSFEVGEHLDSQYEDIFIDTLVKHTDKLLIISWAIEGQGGIGHVNCKNNDYIINKICKKGFKYNVRQTNYLRDCKFEDTPWFKDTLMVFNRL